MSQLGNLQDDIVSVDGKSMRRTLDKASGASALNLVSAWSAKNNLCFGQVKVNEKSNEINATPLLLDLLDIYPSYFKMQDSAGIRNASDEALIEGNR